MSEASRDQNHVTTMLGVSNVDGVTPIPVQIDPVTGRLLVDSTGGSGYTNLTQFVNQTAWRLFYSDGSGDVQELALGANGTVLTSGGAAAVPTWSSAGAGDMTLAGVQTVTGAKTFGTIGGAVGKLILAGSTSGSSILNAAAVAGSTTITLPDATTTLAGLSIANSFTTAQAITPSSDVISLAVRRNGAGQSANILEIQTEANAFLAGFSKTGVLTLPTSGLTLGAVNVTSTGTQINYLNAATGTTGTTSTNLVFSTSPVLTTPTLGVATATTINKVTLTAPATGSTLTILNGKTLTVNHSLTLAGTDSTTMTFPSTSKTIAANDGSNMTLTSQATGDLITAASASTLGRLADVAVGQVLVSGGVGVAPAYSANPNVTTIELGHASDTTFARVSAGVASIEGNNILTAATGLPLAGGTMSGNITLGENTSIALDPAGSADGKYSGITVTGVAGYTQAFGDLVTLDKDDSRWEAVDISVAAAATGDARGVLGMVVSAGTDGTACTILLEGIIRADANFPTLTIGANVYASTSGDIVVAQPTTTDYVIRIVGAALTADEIFFRPDFSWITHT